VHGQAIVDILYAGDGPHGPDQCLVFGRQDVSAAKARVGQAARTVGQEAVQIHGGMGVTDELPAAHMFKRLTLINTTFGDVDHHLGRFASLPEFQQAA